MKYWIPFISSYLSGILAYIILKILQKKGKLKIFDQYLWSPFVVAFSGVCLIINTIWFFYNEQYIYFRSDYYDKWTMIGLYSKKWVVIALYSQFLWISLILQGLAILYKKNILLKSSIFFVWIGVVLSPLPYFLFAIPLILFK